MAAAMGCSMRWAAEAPARRAASLTARRSTEVMADGTQISTRGRFSLVIAGPPQQQADRPLGDVEVGDGPLAQRAHGHDVPRGAADQLPGLVADGQHLVGAGVEGDDRRLLEDDPPALGEDLGVGGPEVDREVPGHPVIVGRPGSPPGRRDRPSAAADAPSLPSRRSITFAPCTETHQTTSARTPRRADDDGPLRGWVPPDDRLWLHPSERACVQDAVAPPDAGGRDRRADAGWSAAWPPAWWSPWWWPCVVLTADATREVAPHGHLGVRSAHHRGQHSQLTDVPAYDVRGRHRPMTRRWPSSSTGPRHDHRRPASSPRPAASSWRSDR